MIVAKNIFKDYGNVGVLKGVDITIKSGEVITIVGASGAGKTTLLQILGTLDSPNKTDSAQLTFNGKSILNLKNSDLAKFRNEEIGFIFQFHQLLPEFTAIENVCIPAFIKGVSKKEAHQKAKDILEFLGLGHRLNHKPDSLSGGEQQRVAVARALINDPKVIFADEPSGNLDSASAEHLHQLFFELRDTYGQTFVIVTHNDQFADMADRKITMADGKLV